MVTKIGLYKDKARGLWRVRWFGKYEPKTGKQKRYSKTFNRKTDAEKFREEKKKEFGQGVRRDESKETLAEYAERWLQCKKEFEGLRPATVLLYEGTLERLYDYFGTDQLLRKIDHSEARNFLASLKPKIKDVESLSNWSRHRVLRHCRTLFGQAAKEGIIAVNPFAGIAGPKCTPSDWYYLKPDEFHRLLDVTPKLKEKVLYALAFTAGLRESEALALYWTDIDFDKGRLSIVNRPATKDYPPFHIKDSDARVIPLPEFTVKLLTQLQSEASEGVPYVLMSEQDCQRIRQRWIRCREQGKDWLNRYWSNNVIRNFHRRIKRVGINPAGKELTVHVLRKCCIQNWANSLPMNVVKELAGHSSIETTNRFYSTVDEAHLDAAARIGDNLLTTDHKMTFSANFPENQRV